MRRSSRPTSAMLVAVLALSAFACSGSDKASSSSSPSSSSASSGTTTSSAAASDASSGRVLRVLVSNDDGVGAPGIDALVRALAAEPRIDVTVVAPSENQSGTGGKTSPAPPPATTTTTASGHAAVAVAGYPADAVLHGLTTVMAQPPDLVVSGVNAGQNLGPFIDVSGTVGAARAAAQRGIPSLAVSAGLADQIDFDSAARLAVDWVRQHRAALLASPPAPTTVDNLNVPTCTTGKVRPEVDVTADVSAPGEQALAASDCTSTAAAPSTDVAAFAIGFATLSHIPLTPAS